MTYKNIKFDESAVMRSLEKLAISKGMIKEEPIKKTAAPKGLSLAPTENLEENILKLCSALRSSGFEKHAAEVEVNFFNLKRAQSYDVHGETGEDLLNQAHPEGSHQMKDLDGDCLVETLQDRQKAIQKIIAKQPTGKLAATREIAGLVKSAGKFEKQDAVNAIKIILGQANTRVTVESIQGPLKNSVTILNTAMSLTEKIGGITEAVMHFLKSRQQEVANASDKAENTFDILSSKDIDNAINAVKSIQESLTPNTLHKILPSWMNKGISEDDSVWDQVNNKLNSVINNLNLANENFKKLSIQGANPEKVEPFKIKEVQIKANEMSLQKNRISNLKSKLLGAKAIGSIASNKQVLKWIDDEVKALDDISNRYSKLPEEQDEAMAPFLKKEIDTEETDINVFYKTWITG